MAPSFDELENTIYVSAQDGKKYAFQAQKRNPNRGYINVLCHDGKRRNVTGYRDGKLFIVDPRGKNARAFDPLSNPKDYVVEKLGPPKRSSRDYSVDEIQAMSPDELEDYKRLVDSELEH